MATQFTPQPFDYEKLNNGKRFENGDGITPNAINAPIEAAAYAQALATNMPDTSNANKVGTPTVSIRTLPNGTPQLVFENLKGATGLVEGNIDNAKGNSETDGYSQRVINDLVSKPNLLINGDFRVNERGLTTYSKQYGVDRWYFNTDVSVNSDKSITLTVRDAEYMVQWLDLSLLAGQNIAISFKYTSSSRDKSAYGRFGLRSKTNVVKSSTFLHYGSGGEVSQYFTVPADAARGTLYGIFIEPLYEDYPEALETFTIKWVKAEVGVLATPFTPKPISQELNDCRYYYRKLSGGGNRRAIFAQGMFSSANSAYIYFPFNFRTRPTVTCTDDVYFYTGAALSVPVIPDEIEVLSDDAVTLILRSSTGGGTAGHSVLLACDTQGYLEFDAEYY